jgi:hypothetical protein
MATIAELLDCDDEVDEVMGLLEFLRLAKAC